MTAARGLQCIRCAAEYPLGPMFSGCPACRARGRLANLTPIYDYAAVRESVSPEGWAARPRSLWRYVELLPVEPGYAVSLGEGGTPLVHVPRLGKRLGLSQLFVKDEGRNPTLSFKDRMASVVITHARQVGARTVAIASSGNAGAALAAYAARAGLDCVVLTLAHAPEAMKVQMQAYGAKLVATPAPANRWMLLQAGVERLGWYAASSYLPTPVGSNPFGVDGYKSIAFEIWEDLDHQVPEAVIFPVCYGDGLWGATKGFEELRTLGWCERSPLMGAAEVFGCLATALEQNAEDVAPVPTGPSVAISIATGLSTYQGLAALRRGGGFAGRVSDEEILAMQRQLAELEGLFVEPSSAPALVLAGRGRRDGTLGQDDRVVAVVTASGLKDPPAAARQFPAVPVLGEVSLSALTAALQYTYQWSPS
jgi:threonine synthase